MDLALSTLSAEDRAYLKTCKIVVIIGKPCAGKTFVADYIQEEILSDHSIFHSDDYIDYGYKESLYALIKEMQYDPNPRKIVEGVQGYRFLRKNLELNYWTIDAVIEVVCRPEERQRRYSARGKGNLPEGFEKNLTTVFESYKAALTDSMPRPRFMTVFT